MEQFDNREVNSVGSSRIRARWLWEEWNKVFPDDCAEQYVIGSKPDVMVFQKVYWDQMLDSFKGIKIFDICDPDWLDGRNVMESIGKCNACTTSTEPLAEFIRKFVNIPVICIPDRIKLSEHTPRGEHTGKAKKIVWFGYSHNQHYLHFCLEFLAEKGLELVVISNQPYVPPTGFEFVKITNYTYTYPQVHNYIKECDLYLAPETGDERGKFKSNNKALTAMALGIPVVRVPEDLDRLITAEARNEQVKKDLEEIKSKWLVEESVKQLKGLINDCNEKDKS